MPIYNGVAREEQSTFAFISLISDNVVSLGRVLKLVSEG